MSCLCQVVHIIKRLWKDECQVAYMQLHACKPIRLILQELAKNDSIHLISLWSSCSLPPFTLPLLPVIHQYHSTLLDQASQPFVAHSPWCDRMCLRNGAGILLSRVWDVWCVYKPRSSNVRISLWSAWAASKANWHHRARSAATKACAWALNASNDTFLSSCSPWARCCSNACRSCGVGICNTISSYNYTLISNSFIYHASLYIPQKDCVRSLGWQMDLV